MKKPERSFVVEIDQKAHIGVSPESLLSIQLIGSRTWPEPKTYHAPVAKVFEAIARLHREANPPPVRKKRRRRRSFESNAELRAWLKEHPEETPQL